MEKVNPVAGSELKTKIVNLVDTLLPKMGNFFPPALHIDDRMRLYGRTVASMFYGLSSYGTGVAIAVWNGEKFDVILEDDTFTTITDILSRRKEPHFWAVRKANRNLTNSNQFNRYLFLVCIGNSKIFGVNGGDSSVINDHFDTNDNFLNTVEKKINTHGKAVYPDTIYNPAVKFTVLSNIVLDGKTFTVGTDYKLRSIPKIKKDDIGKNVMLDMIFSKMWKLDVDKFPESFQEEFIKEVSKVFVHTDSKSSNGEIIAMENYQGMFVKSVDFFLRAPGDYGVVRYRLPVISNLLSDGSVK